MGQLVSKHQLLDTDESLATPSHGPKQSDGRNVIKVDPRSPPPLEFNRTPIVVGETKGRVLCDPRSPTYHIDRTPVIVKGRPSSDTSAGTHAAVTSFLKTAHRNVMANKENEEEMPLHAQDPATTPTLDQDGNECRQRLTFSSAST